MGAFIALIGVMTVVHFPIQAVKDGVRTEADFASWIMDKDIEFVIRMRNTIAFGASTCMLGLSLSFMPNI